MKASLFRRAHQRQGQGGAAHEFIDRRVFLAGVAAVHSVGQDDSLEALLGQAVIIAARLPS